MAAIAAFKPETKLPSLPKNRTGLFAADTIHDVKTTRNHLITVPTLSPQFRQTASTNLLFASAEQNHHQMQQHRLSNFEIQQFYPLDKTNAAVVDSSNDSRAAGSGIRNGFRPSTIRHQKSRLPTAVSQRNEVKESLPKSAAVQSRASAKIKSEIDHINHKLTRTKESSKSLRVIASGDLEEPSPSVLSYNTSYRGSSASTHLTADRIHQRFTSAITHLTANTRLMNHHTSEQATPITPVLAESPSSQLIIPEADENEEVEINDDHQGTRSYQIPQQSNVGSESIFVLNPSSTKKQPVKNIRPLEDMKSISCPFYVMYFTNLAMQQRQNQDNTPNDRATYAVSSAIRRVPVNSRISTAYPRRQLTRRQVSSPISMNTYSTLDENDALTNSSNHHYNKRLSMKSTSLENENLHQLRDILRTTSLNHVQV